MDVKIAKFVPLVISGLVGLAEFFDFVFYHSFNLRWYLVPNSYYISLWTFLDLVHFALKLVLILGSAFVYYQYSKGDLKLAKTISLALPGIWMVRIIFSLMSGIGGGIIYFLLNILAIFATIANLVVALTVKGEGEARPQRQPVYYNQPPVQQYQPPMPLTPQGGQSIPDQLAALQSLVDNGTLTQAEFKAAKQRIIGG
jgi:hypothetical protein